MKTPLVTIALATLFAAPAGAQRMGSSNANAPRIEQKMNLGQTGEVRLDYIAITWGKGNWAKMLEDEKIRDRMRERINQVAQDAPLGSFECSEDVTVGGVLVPAGEYALSFQLDEEFHWQMVLADDESDREVRVALDLHENPEPSKRLVVALYAGDEDFTGGIYLAFGGWSGMLEIGRPQDEV